MTAFSIDEPRSLLDAVEAVARHAAVRILEVYSRTFDVHEKGDGSPLTEADEASHQAIVGGLRRLTPGLHVLSEESVDVPVSERRRWTRFWLVDPLDGTKEFIKRNGEFTVNIALVENDRPVLGVVHVPATGVSYLGAGGLGAWKIDKSGLHSIRTTAFSGGTVRVVASRSHADHRLTQYLASIGDHDLVSVGSSLKFCLVAEGRADVYPRLAPTMEWDTAAAHVIVEAAGGRVHDAIGRPLRYNKPALRNPWIIACGSGDRDWTEPLRAEESFSESSTT